MKTIKHCLVTLFVLSTASISFAEDEIIVSRPAVTTTGTADTFYSSPGMVSSIRVHEKLESKKKHPNAKLLSDLKPGESCFTNEWAFIDSFPCVKKMTGLLDAVAVNANGTIYVQGRTLEENTRANRSH